LAWTIRFETEALRQIKKLDRQWQKRVLDYLMHEVAPLANLCGRRTLREQVPSRETAPLIPKLRGYFAEFLNHSSLDRLGILYLTTCVGLGYGPLRTR